MPHSWDIEEPDSKTGSGEPAVINVENIAAAKIFTSGNENKTNLSRLIYFVGAGLKDAIRFGF